MQDVILWQVDVDEEAAVIDEEDLYWDKEDKMSALELDKSEYRDIFGHSDN